MREPFPKDLVEALERAAAGPHGLSLPGEGEEPERLSYAALLQDARAWGGAFRDAGVAPGDRVVVVLPTSADFVRAFFGLALAGAVPSAQPLPPAFGDVVAHAELLRRTARYLEARAVVLPDAFAAAGKEDGAVATLTPGGLRRRAVSAGAALRRGEAGVIAYVQCTSGSTGEPKGAVLTQGCLLSNVQQIGIGVDVTPEDRVASWLPLYHDMGLIGCLVFAVAWDLDATFVAPSTFLRRPASWLGAVSASRATLSPAPNFAFQYAATRIKDEELEGVDLGSWRVAFCGGEPVDARTLQAFESRFRGWGLRDGVVLPCYGLAEATLAVTFHAHGMPLEVARLDRAALAERGVALPAAPDDPTAVEVTSSGLPLPPARVRIVDRDGRTLPEGVVGTVQVASPSVMVGYWKLPEATAEALRDGWLDTGDRGFLRDGKLHITGREKDVIIIRGRNHDPSDFEWAAGEVEGVRRGGVAAFGVADLSAGTESLVLICETEIEDAWSRDELRRAIRARVALRTDVSPGRVELWGKNEIPKTTSGKVQRGKARALLLER